VSPLAFFWCPRPVGLYWVYIQRCEYQPPRWDVAWYLESPIAQGTDEFPWDHAGIWLSTVQLGLLEVGPHLGFGPRATLQGARGTWTPQTVLLELPL
jgi:hypothetical protein